MQEAMSYDEQISLQESDGLAVPTPNRPAALNALRFDMFAEMNDAPDANRDAGGMQAGSGR